MSIYFCTGMVVTALLCVGLIWRWHTAAIQNAVGPVQNGALQPGNVDDENVPE